MAKHSTPSRKSLFRAALALNGITAQEWAAQNGITGGTVSAVLAGYRKSADLDAKIDAYIKRHMGKQTALAS